MTTSSGPKGKVRGTRADAEVGDKLYLLKNVSVLYATYQVRLLAFRAQKEGKRLIIRMPPASRLGRSLERLLSQMKGTVVVEKTEK
jgi:hypothetical protein